MPQRRSRRGSRRRQRRHRSPTSCNGVTFSMSQVERLLPDGHYAQRLGWSAPIFLAGVVQYLTTKILELAGNEAQNSGMRHITPEIIDRAIHNNALLSGFFQTTTLSQVAPAQW